MNFAPKPLETDSGLRQPLPVQAFKRVWSLAETAFSGITRDPGAVRNAEQAVVSRVVSIEAVEQRIGEITNKYAPSSRSESYEDSGDSILEVVIDLRDDGYTDEQQAEIQESIKRHPSTYL